MAGETGQEAVKARAVFDCMVYLQGAGRPAGPAAACLRRVEEGAVALCISAEILAEVRDVLTRPKTRQKFPTLTPEWVESFVQNVESKALVFSEVPQAVALPRDPKDERYLNLAVAAGVQYLVSRDKDLLDLMDDETFGGRHPAGTILDPPAFLRALAELERAEHTMRTEPETPPTS